MFNGRRQSRDRLVIEDILRNLNGNKLYIKDYSIPLFKDNEYTIFKDDTVISDNDFLFLENCDTASLGDSVTEIIIYRWNKNYPYDMTLDINLSQWKLSTSEEFNGSSHHITKEIYTK